ncbi:MAG: hypothetical protein GY910_21615 [bacterium]|nr:hypothetical protein [bacterium]
MEIPKPERHRGPPAKFAHIADRVVEFPTQECPDHESEQEGEEEREQGRAQDPDE